MSRLGRLETLARENDRFAADVAAAELVRTVAKTLKEMRERAGLTQSQLGEAIGLTQGRVSQLESGLMDHAPNLETIALYANACGESMSIEASGELQAAEFSV
jgi:transcriptional regulator with XRE-family HTH domain